MGELQQRVSSTEFVEWGEYLGTAEYSDKIDYYYLAQIAAEVRRSASKEPGRVKIKDFMLEFIKEKPRATTKEEIIQNGKNFWFAVLAIKE